MFSPNKYKQTSLNYNTLTFNNFIKETAIYQTLSQTRERHPHRIAPQTDANSPPLSRLRARDLRHSKGTATEHVITSNISRCHQPILLGVRSNIGRHEEQYWSREQAIVLFSATYIGRRSELLIFPASSQEISATSSANGTSHQQNSPRRHL